MDLNIQISYDYLSTINDIEFKFSKNKVRRRLNLPFNEIIIQRTHSFSMYSYDIYDGFITYYNYKNVLIGIEIDCNKHNIILNNERIVYKTRNTILKWFENNNFNDEYLDINDNKIKHIILNISILFDQDNINKFNCIILT